MSKPSYRYWYWAKGQDKWLEAGYSFWSMFYWRRRGFCVARERIIR